jgi:hypothetical protein
MLATWVPDLDWDANNQSYVGLSNMFDVPATNSTFANFKDANVNTPNIGLLDNSIIPTLVSPIIDRKSDVKDSNGDDIPVSGE